MRGAGDPSVLAIEERAVRAPGPGEVRVKVAAAGLNRADVLQRRGGYAAPAGAPADVLGLEYAGTVEAVGEGVSSPAAGERVMGIVAGGGMCEHLVVHAREAVPVPGRLDLPQAAAIPEVFFTAWDALFEQADLRPGASLLVHAVGSGVGTAAIQIARAIGATSIGTSRSADKLARCQELGLDHGIVVGSEPAFAAEVEALSPGGADVILDAVGGAYLGENARCLAPRGTLVALGLLGGATGALPLGLLLRKRARIVGTVLRGRPLEEKIALARRFAREALPLFARGVLRPVIDQVLPMTEIAAAHRAMEEDRTFGKIVLTW